MKVSKIVFAQYDKDDKVKVGLSLPRNEDNIKITEPLIKSEKIKCSKDVIVSCEKCNEKQCNIFFNNYTGLFSYKNGGNIEQILVIHKNSVDYSINHPIKKYVKNVLKSVTEK